MTAVVSTAKLLFPDVGLEAKAMAEEVDPVGAVRIFAPRSLVFVPAYVPVGAEIDMAMLDVTPARNGACAFTVTAVASCEPAYADTVDIKPRPNAETATSAMRLRVVFVDICFLSIVDPRTFPGSAWHKKALSYDMSASFCAS
jgi:hypothetical protein